MKHPKKIGVFWPAVSFLATVAALVFAGMWIDKSKEVNVLSLRVRDQETRGDVYEEERNNFALKLTERCKNEGHRWQSWRAYPECPYRLCRYCGEQQCRKCSK